MLRLDPPAPRLQAALARRGVDVSAERAQAAFAAEIAYYLDHHLEGRDAASLDALRERCAEILQEALETNIDGATARAALLEAIHFEPFPDAAPALSALRAGGLRLAVASNWDVSVHEALAAAGLTFDAVVSSAEAGAAKPAPEPLALALAKIGCPPERALYVGDSPATDLASAAAAGMSALIVDRAGGGDIERLTELPALIFRAA